MPIVIAALTFAVQLYFIVHVFRSGRPYWWALIILSFPIIGSIVYYVMEILPESRGANSARKRVSALVKHMNPDAGLKQRAEELATCGSVDNKLALARECLAARMPEEAVQLFDSALTGTYAKNTDIRLELAAALLEADQPGRALGVASELAKDDPAFKRETVTLIRARALAATGDAIEASKVYEALVPNYAGLEAKTRYALLLKELGHTKQAEALFDEVIEHAKRFRLEHESELAWVDVAKKALRG